MGRTLVRRTPVRGEHLFVEHLFPVDNPVDNPLVAYRDWGQPLRLCGKPLYGLLITTYLIHKPVDKPVDKLSTGCS